MHFKKRRKEGWGCRGQCVCVDPRQPPLGWAEEGAANLHCSPGKDADSTSPLCPCLPLPRAQSQAFPPPPAVQGEPPPAPPATCKAIDTLFAPWAPVGCHCVCFPSAGSRGCHVEERRGLTQSASVVARREPWVWSGVPAGADNLPREAPAFACSCGKHRRGDLVLLGGLLQRGRGDPFEQGLCRESASAFRTCHPQRLPS